jgi:hypothetical protein
MRNARNQCARVRTSQSHPRARPSRSIHIGTSCHLPEANRASQASATASGVMKPLVKVQCWPVCLVIFAVRCFIEETPMSKSTKGLSVLGVAKRLRGGGPEWRFLSPQIIAYVLLACKPNELIRILVAVRPLTPRIGLERRPPVLDPVSVEDTFKPHGGLSCPTLPRPGCGTRSFA